MLHFTRQYEGTLQKRFMILMSFCSKFIRIYAYTNNYSNKERFDNVITKNGAVFLASQWRPVVVSSYRIFVKNSFRIRKLIQDS